MKADRGLTIQRMVELGAVSRASFYRFGEDRRQRPDADMDLRDAIQRIALEWPSYGRPRITAELRRRGWVRFRAAEVAVVHREPESPHCETVMAVAEKSR